MQITAYLVAGEYCEVICRVPVLTHATVTTAEVRNIIHFLRFQSRGDPSRTKQQRTRATIKVHNFFSGVVQFRRLRHALLSSKKTDLENIKTAAG